MFQQIGLLDIGENDCGWNFQIGLWPWCHLGYFLFNENKLSSGPLIAFRVYENVRKSYEWRNLNSQVARKFKIISIANQLEAIILGWFKSNLLKRREEKPLTEFGWQDELRFGRSPSSQPEQRIERDLHNDKETTVPSNLQPTWRHRDGWLPHWTRLSIRLIITITSLNQVLKLSELDSLVNLCATIDLVCECAIKKIKLQHFSTAQSRFGKIFML